MNFKRDHSKVKSVCLMLKCTKLQMFKCVCKYLVLTNNGADKKDVLEM